MRAAANRAQKLEEMKGQAGVLGKEVETLAASALVPLFGVV